MIPRLAIKNIRYGLATNSSSSHSIIHNEGIATMEDIDFVNGEFGWNFFTAKTKAERESYMMSQLQSNLPYGMAEVIKTVLTYEGIEESKFLSGYVDHDSVMNLPRLKNSDVVNMDFFDDYYQYITNNYFVFLGGNDNTDECHNLSDDDDGKMDSYAWSFKEGDRAYRNGNYWVIFNKDRKMRLQFEGEAIKAAEPELIDLKITDYCDAGCSFCYQGSTREGMHADFNILDAITGLPHYENIVEFAIGGGEPTSHPNFKELLEKIHARGHIANFTTKTTKWMDNKEVLSAVKECVSGVAYSPDNIEDVKKFVSAHDENVGARVSLYLHIIPEIWTNKNLNDLRVLVQEMNQWNGSRGGNVAKIKITMLGYKTTGRGSSMSPGRKEDLIDYIKSYSNTQIGIDTKIVNDYEDKLSDSDIDKLLFTSQEGEFSMYIDAVEKKAYISSYELDNPVDIIKETWGGDKKYVRLHNIKGLFGDIK